MNLNYPCPEQDYTVLVRCFTFNQSKYIEDALNGFVIQQTTFPFVCLVVDDASTDGEQEVIKSWIERECDMAGARHIDIPTANIIIVPHRTTKNCTMAIYLLKENLYRQRERKMKHVAPWRAHCRYEALCEGDDYWTEPLKLQKQVDFMESHPDCSLCYHASKNIFNEDFSGFKHGFGEIVRTEYDYKDLLISYPFQTATVIYRMELIYSDIYKSLSKHCMYSSFLFLCASQYGRLYGINEQMSVYRRTNEGISNDFHNGKQTYNIIQLWIEISKYFKKEIGYDIHHITIYHRLYELFFISRKLFFKACLSELYYYPMNVVYIFKRLTLKFLRDLKS